MNQTQKQGVNAGFLTNLKWWQATIMIAVILVACGWAAMQGVNVLVNVNLEAKVKDLIANPLQIAKYIVYGDGTTYSLQNCTSGQYIYSSTNATTTISIAFGNLTSNRTWKEKCFLKATSQLTRASPRLHIQ